MASKAPTTTMTSAKFQPSVCKSRINVLYARRFDDEAICRRWLISGIRTPSRRPRGQIFQQQVGI